MTKHLLWEGQPPLWVENLGTLPCLEMDEDVEASQPFVLVLPGGGYRWLAPHEAEPIAGFFRTAGYPTGILSYRIATDATTEPLGLGPLLDAQRAIRLIRQKHGKDRKIVLVGFSAGGHLSACCGVYHAPLVQHPSDDLSGFSTRPDALVLCYPWITSTYKVHQRSIDTLCGLNDQAGLHGFFNLFKEAWPETPPSFLWHTADDPVVPVENSLGFASALAGLKIPFTLHVFPHGVHGLGLAGNDALAGRWPGLAADWLRSLAHLHS